MTFELAIKMILSVHFQYRKEEHAWRPCVTLCVAILDCGCTSPRLLQQQEERDSWKQTSQNFSTFLSHCYRCCWLTCLPIVDSIMTKRISLSFRIKYTKLSPLRLNDGSLCLQQKGVHSW
jgi:hypothetical protein